MSIYIFFIYRQFNLMLFILNNLTPYSASEFVSILSNVKIYKYYSHKLDIITIIYPLSIFPPLISVYFCYL